jgi:hypothetical protein
MDSRAPPIAAALTLDGAVTPAGKAVTLKQRAPLDFPFPANVLWSE